MINTTPQSHQQMLLSPNNNGQTMASLDVHETASNHSGHSSSNNNNHHHPQYTSPDLLVVETNNLAAVSPPADSSSVTTTSSLSQASKKTFKTEYKSKFKPFSEYAYNEVTDSFVKCHHSAAECSSSSSSAAAAAAATAISASRSNQDLSGDAAAAAAAAAANQITISTHDAGVFEPSDGSEFHAVAGGSVAEPWYKEVVKRNEKANEYRFKSEVGHNSPLLNYTNSSSTARSDSPFTQQFNNNADRLLLTSPSGAPESIIGSSSVGGGDNNLNEIRSQHQLNNDPLEQQQQPTKAQFRFTPSSYKRDNLIAHMANNNNFNLPKEQEAAAANAREQQPRRAIAQSSSARARSQSSRRLPAASTPNQTTTVNSSNRVQSASKSQHTTPTRSLASRSNVTMRPTNASASKSHSKTPAACPGSASSRYATTTRTPTSANGSGGLASKRTPTVPAASSAGSRATPKPAPSLARPHPTNSSRTTAPLSAASAAKKTTTTVPSTTRPATSTMARPKTAAPSTPAASKVATESPASSRASGLKVGKLPITNARAPPTSANKKKTSTSKTSEASGGSTTAVKSIKTRKAIESETAKAAAAAATAAAATVAGFAVATEASPTTNLSAGEPHGAQSTTEPATIAPQEPTRYSTEEQNLIFTTTEAGDMLADELAQAEMAQAESAATNHILSKRDTQLLDQVETTTILDEPSNEPEKRSTSSFDEGDAKQQLDDANQQGGELVNGLAGGLVSAEDRFDSSERDDLSVNASEANQFQQQQHQEQNFNDEPYSIIPTSADNMGEDQPVSSSLNEDGPGATFEVTTSAGDGILLPDNTQKISQINLGDSDDDKHRNQGEDKPEGDGDHISTLEPASQSTTNDEDILTQLEEQLQQDMQRPHQNDDDDDESDSDVPSKLGEAVELINSSSGVAALDVSQSSTIESAPETRAPIEDSLRVELPASSILATEPDSSTVDLIGDEKGTNAAEINRRYDYDQENRDFDSSSVADSGKRDETPQDNSGDISNDEPHNLTHNLTTSDDDGFVFNLATLGTRDELAPTQQQQQQHAANESDSDSDLMAQEDLMGGVGETAAAAIHSVDKFIAITETKLENWLPKTEDHTISSRWPSDNEPGSSANLLETKATTKEEPLRFAGEDLNEKIAGEIDGVVLSDFTDDKGDDADMRLMPDVTQKISQINSEDDIDSDEHLKLSNNLTNSDDELILKPGNLKSDDDLTSTRQQKQEDDDDESDLVFKKEAAATEGKADSVEVSSHETFQSKPIEMSEVIKFSDEQQLSGGSGAATYTENLMGASAVGELVGPSNSAPKADTTSESCKIFDTTEKTSDAPLSPGGDAYDFSQTTNLVDFGATKEGLIDDLNTNTSDSRSARDGLILDPGNLNAGNADDDNVAKQLAHGLGKQGHGGESDLDLMAQEDRLEGTVELGDGSSAALEVPTSIENRVEMSTSKSQTDEPDMLQANFKFARKISDDSDGELDIDPEEDPIGSAATLSPNTSVAEELMRFNAVKDNIGLDHGLDMDRSSNSAGSEGKYMFDLTSSGISSDDHQDIATNNYGSSTTNINTKGSTMQSVNLTSHVIDETVKQLSPEQ